MTPEEAAKTDQPVMFISFPSAKDPKAWAQKYPGKIEFLAPYHLHTGKCIRRFGGIYAYCRYFIDRKWLILVLIQYRKT